MDETNEPEATQDLEVTEAEAEETTEDSDDPQVLKARIKKLEEKAIAQRERTKIVKQELAKKEKEEEKSSKITGDLDNADYALLEVRGIMEGDPRIDYIKDKLVKWQMPLRELLKDEDVQAKLKSLKIEGEVRAATPGSTRRSSGGTSDNEDYWFQKYEQTGKLPDVMPPGMAEKLVNRRYSKENPRANPFE